VRELPAQKVSKAEIARRLRIASAEPPLTLNPE
jgi:hypothetical protein